MASVAGDCVTVNQALDRALEELEFVNEVLNRELTSGQHVDRSVELNKSIKLNSVAGSVNYLLRACQDV